MKLSRQIDGRLRESQLRGFLEQGLDPANFGGQRIGNLLEIGSGLESGSRLRRAVAVDAQSEALRQVIERGSIVVNLSPMTDLHDQYGIRRLDLVDHAVIANAQATRTPEAVAQRFAKLDGIRT